MVKTPRLKDEGSSVVNQSLTTVKLEWIGLTWDTFSQDGYTLVKHNYHRHPSISRQGPFFTCGKDLVKVSLSGKQKYPVVKSWFMGLR
jgi:hypothetical protein